jgi:RecG-like helicase
MEDSDDCFVLAGEDISLRHGGELTTNAAFSDVLRRPKVKALVSSGGRI